MGLFEMLFVEGFRWVGFEVLGFGVWWMLFYEMVGMVWGELGGERSGGGGRVWAGLGIIGVAGLVGRGDRIALSSFL